MLPYSKHVKFVKCLFSFTWHSFGQCSPEHCTLDSIYFFFQLDETKMYHVCYIPDMQLTVTYIGYL